MQKIENMCKYIILMMWGVIIFYLTFLSMRGTSAEAMRNTAAPGEDPLYLSHVYYLLDNPWKHIIFLFVFVLFGVIIKQILNKCGRKCNNILGVLSNCKLGEGLLLLSLIIGIAYILNTQLIPSSDPQKLQVIAEEMHRGDFHQFLEGEYMHRYPFQSGFLLLIYYIMSIFSDKTFLFMQLLNVLAVTMTYYGVYKIVYIIWSEKSNLILALEILFLPMLLYTTFVYGNILSFCMAIYAVYFEYKFFSEKKLLYAICSAILISLSIIFKSNSLIILCAMIIYAVYYLICKEQKKNKLKMLVYIALIIFFYFAGNKIVEVHMESIIDMELPEGMPKSTWIAMGLEEGGMAPGYWNGTSVSLYTENDYDYEKTNQAALENIVNSIKKYIKDWRLGLDFFGRKIAAEWNEPTFQGIAISQGRVSEISIPAWMQSIYNGRGSIFLTNMLNMLQTWIYFGVCLYIISRFKKSSLDELLFATIMIGGFIFHLFWEGKSQYVMNYFFLLIPYSVLGYQLAVEKLSALITNTRNGSLKFSTKKDKIVVGMVFLLLLFMIPAGKRITQMKTYQYTLGVRSSDELLEEYDVMIRNMKEDKNF